MSSLSNKRPGPFAAAMIALSAACLLAPLPLSAQGKKKEPAGAEKIEGTISAITKKGKAVTLTVNRDGGDDLTVLVTPRLRFSVTGKGGIDLIQPRTVVSSESVIMSNNELFGRKFTIHAGNAPAAHVRRDPTNPEVYQVCGQVIAVEKEWMSVNFGGSSGTRKVTFEPGELEITVTTADPELVEEGDKVELEGTTRGTKFLPSRVAVTREKPLSADDLAPKNKNAKKKAKPVGAKTSRRGAKGKAADADDEEVPGAESDPFGVLNKPGKKKPAENKGSEEPKDGDAREDEE